MDLSFISRYRALISDIIQIGAWLLVLVKLYRKTDTVQNKKIDRILEKLDSIEQSEIAGLETSIKILVKRLFTRTCLDCIKKGYTTEADLDIVESLYTEYSQKYKLNGHGTELYKKVLKLPLEETGEI